MGVGRMGRGRGGGANEQKAGESNEMFVYLQHCIRAYAQDLDVKLCKNLVRVYDAASRRIFRLKEAWERYHSSK